ncbi:MAG: hypothetical protein M3Z21_17500 [Pseudomonadota bacterium]|nr:hypothetical protein [Pseudomonadota bacterium]
MARRFPFELLEDPAELARYHGWSEQVYADLLAVQRGTLSPQAFDARYLRRKALLVLDLTGFTVSALRGGALHSFLRILDAQKVCLPVLRQGQAELIWMLADNMFAVFDQAGPALDAALEIHRRNAQFAASERSGGDAAQCCIGIGYGPVYRIGPNLAMGDEMNRTCKLGEDIARGGETLVTEGAVAALRGRADVTFEPQAGDDLLFPYYRVA